MPETLSYESRLTRRPFALPRWSGALAAMAALMIYTGLKEPSFFKLANLINIAHDQSAAGILAVGMAVVIILGGIDLSVGSMMAFSGGLAILALNHVLVNHGELLAVFAALITALLVGIGAGFVNGLLIAKGRLAPFITTLVMLLAYRSAAIWIANSGNYKADDCSLLQSIAGGIAIPHTNISRNIRRVIPLEFPYEVIALLVVVIIVTIMINHTRIGRYIIAIGNNERAARYSAIAVPRVKMIVYVLMGFLAALAGFLEAARYASVNSSNLGLMKELDAIAAAVIGGTRMEGGSGSIVGAVIGVLLLGVIHNIIVMLGINSQAQGLVTGVIIIVAALVQRGKPT